MEGQGGVFISNNKPDILDGRVCPKCNASCVIIPISRFDLSCKRYGGVFVCPVCHWDDWGNMYLPEEVERYKKKFNLKKKKRICLQK